MLPLHYAAFFDAAPILRVLLKASSARGTETYRKLCLSFRIKDGYLSLDVHAQYVISYQMLISGVRNLIMVLLCTLRQAIFAWKEPSAW